MGVVAIPIPHGGGGIGELLHLLFRLALWHALFHAMRVFLIQYTHVPWIGTVIIVVIVVALIRFVTYRRR